MVKKLILVLLFSLFFVLEFFYTDSVSAWIPASVRGRVFGELPDGSRIPLPGVKIYRLDWWTWSYCGAENAKCWGVNDVVETTVKPDGSYYMGNRMVENQADPAPMCKTSRGANRCPTKRLFQENRVCSIDAQSLPICDSNILLCTESNNPVYAYELNWCGFNCGSNPHRWGPYFPEGYSLPQHLIDQGLSHKFGKWYIKDRIRKWVEAEFYEEGFANNENKAGFDFKFKFIPLPTPTPTPTATPTVTPTPTATPTPTNTPTPSPTPTNTPTPTPTFIVTAFPTPSHNKTGTMAPVLKPGQTWYCMQSEYYDGTIKPGGKTDHRLLLKVNNLPANKDIYIVGCVSRNGNVACTTGNASNDQKLSIRPASDHEFIVDPPNPLQLTQQGSQLTKVVYSHTKTTATHTFFSVFFSGVSGGSSPDGSHSSVQYGTIGFGQKDEEIKKCVAIYWDPYGRVFDSLSLEPIPNAKIQLVTDTDSIYTRPGLINPVLTEADGLYNFLVEDGRYKLQVTPPSGYEFKDKIKLNEKYNLIYTDPYKPNEVIVETADNPVHKDIALYPKDGKGKAYPVKSIDFEILPSANNNIVKIVGRVSHPFTIVKIVQSRRVVAQTIADRFGSYELIVNRSDVDQLQGLTPIFEKNPEYYQVEERGFLKDLWESLKRLFRFDISADTRVAGKEFLLPPVQIQGYIKDAVTLALVDQSTNKVYSQHNIADNGFVNLSYQDLPKLPFYFIVKTKTGQVYTMSLKQFIDENKEYLILNNINLFSLE